MKQILFPLKTETSNTHHIQKWDAMDPLAFAEYIAREVGPTLPTLTPPPITTLSRKGPNLAQRRGQAPLTIHTTFLAQEFPPVPSSPHNAAAAESVAVGTLPSHITSKFFQDVQESSAEPITLLPSTPHCNGRQDRKRPVPPPPLPTPCNTRSAPTLVPCDEESHDEFHFLSECPPELSTTTNNTSMQELQESIHRLKSMPNYNYCASSYHRFLMEWSTGYKSIQNMNDSSLEAKQDKWSQLYSHALEQVKALISMAEHLQKPKPSNNDEIPNENTTHEYPQDNPEPSPHHHHPDPQDPPSSKTTGRYNKKTFTECMNQWLVDNWTNPYPDDEGIATLVDKTGTTPTIVSNWFINARTRKWRPAIVKAYDNGRPADLLKEDSIRIFQRKPLRKVEKDD